MHRSIVNVLSEIYQKASTGLRNQMSREFETMDCVDSSTPLDFVEEPVAAKYFN